MLLWIIIFLLSFSLTWLYRKFALYKSLLDIPNDRSSHAIPTPKGGGIAVAISWFLGITYLSITGELENQVFFALLMGIPLVIIGFIDDILNIKPFVRFVIQAFVAGLGLFFLGGINLHSWQGSYLIPIIILALIAIVWFINLFNFLDGIDGYIGSEIVFIGISAYLLTGEKTGLLLTLSVSGFLIWNWPKAKIFMGDTGSTLMGYIVAVMIIYFQNTQKTSVFVWIILTSVFWFDATITILRRLINKENIFQAHRKHAFQRIVQAGFSHQKAVVYSLLLNIIGFSLAFLAHKYPSFEYLLLFSNLLILTLIYLKIERLNPFAK
jgi:Fuc2NAc and GlcNAc transferase